MTARPIFQLCCYVLLFGEQHGALILPSRGGEWYLEKRGSRKILAGSRNLGSVFDKSRSLVFSWFAFTFFESRNFSPKSFGLGFLTWISASRRVSDFTIRHPSQCLCRLIIDCEQSLIFLCEVTARES